MPGLPRASTARQFKKLMKKSGKARTNKSAGATDPASRKIATYEQYFALKEGRIRWFNKGEFEDGDVLDVDDFDDREWKKGDEVWAKNGELFGSIEKVDNDNDTITVRTVGQSQFIAARDKFLTYGFVHH